MLSVGGSGARSRSKSPGRRDERDRSRTRDMRAPSPARAPAPVTRASKYYDNDDDDDEDEDLVSDHEGRRRGYSRDHERALVRDPRGNRDYRDDDDDDDDDEEEEEYAEHRRRNSKYADPDKHRYATEEDVRAKTYRRGDPRSKEYAVPGQFDEEEEALAYKEHRQERPNGQGRSASYGTTKGGYEQPAQFQYAQIDPREVRYVGGGKAPYTRSPSESNSAYTRTPQGQVTVASSRHGREAGHDSRDQRAGKDKYGRADERGMSRRELERLEKERDELKRQQDLRRQLDELKREKEEREELELKQKRGKSVQIKDDRDRDRRESKSKHDRKLSKYSDEELERKRGDTRRRYADEEDSSESDEDERLEKLYHAKYREDDRHDDRYDDRRDDRKREKEEKRRERTRRDSDEQHSKHQVVEIHPGARGSLSAPSQGLASRTRGLSVGSHTPGALSLAAPGAGGHQRRGSFGGAPPGSPLLESYRGTYQSISPMPSPMALAHHPDDSDLSDLDLATVRRRKKRSSDEDSSEDELGRKGRKPKSILKRAQEMGVPNYDPDHDATALAKELKGSSPSPEVLIKTLPTLSNDSIVLLRQEYKKHAKIQGKGINIAKHIKLKVSGNIGKAAYAVALGRWESEAHWANFWYQSGSSRRELLIECLFGRSNAEVKAIKEAFTDKRYGDSLVKCMESELKKDKFRVAVLKALEAKRDEHPELNMKQVDKDVQDLHKALISKDGGETAMLTVIVVRTDEHLRAVLQEYEQVYQQNFAREMVKRSQNLVGETLAHVLNGAINRPVRDALLLHQAVAETSKDRAELIISRLVRLHWEPRHLARVKVEYAKRYRSELEYDIEEGTKGNFSQFCVALCRGAIR